MVIENDFLPFATASGANVLSQSAYVALGALGTGFQSGVASSAQLNKVWRQSSIMSAVLAQFIVNSTGQPAIDDGTTATLLANLTAAISAQSEATIGAARNVFMSVTAASATATLTADEIVIGSALGGLKYTLSSFSKTINLATTGAGGMDTGAAPASGYVALYAIYNPATGASALLATNATSAAAPNVYGGANMPGGYTASALVSVWPTSSSQFVVGTQRDRKIARSSVQVLSTTSTVTTTPLTVSSAIPPNAVACSGILEVTNGSSSTAPAISVYANAQSCGQQSIDVYETTGTTLNSPFNDLMVSVPSTIYYGTSTTSGTSTYAIRITAYSI